MMMLSEDASCATPEKQSSAATHTPTAVRTKQSAPHHPAQTLLDEAVGFSLSTPPRHSLSTPPRQRGHTLSTPPRQRAGGSQSMDSATSAVESPVSGCFTPQRLDSSTPCSTPLQFSNVRLHSPAASDDEDEQACPICMECVDSAPPTPSNSLKPPRSPFKTACCKQLFHRACMAKYRECAADHAGCPLCRSLQETGLTPLETQRSRFRARTTAAAGGREAILARHAAARQAVQARAAAEAELLRVQMEEAARVTYNELFDSDF